MIPRAEARGVEGMLPIGREGIVRRGRGKARQSRELIHRRGCMGKQARRVEPCDHHQDTTSFHLVVRTASLMSLDPNPPAPPVTR
jgi:hypothetical protein